MRLSLVLLLLLPAVACDGTYLSAHVEAPDICATGMEVQFPPAIAAEAAGKTEKSLSVDDLGLDGSALLEGEVLVEITSVTLVATEGADDLAFVDLLRMRATPVDEDRHGKPDRDAPVVVAMDGGDLVDGTLHVEPETPVDITEHLRAREVLFGVELAGDLPDLPWRGELDVCIRAETSYSRSL